MARSPAERLAARYPDTADLRAALEAHFGTDPVAVTALVRSWRFWARPEQIAGDWLWRWWVIITGRGWGKTRTAAEWVVDRCEAFARVNAPHKIGLVNRSFDTVRSLQIEGESGLGAVCGRRGYRLDHAPTSLHGRLWIPLGDNSWHSSAIEVHTADDPDRVRGPNFNTAWCEELSAWRHKVDAQGGTAFSNLDLALRADGPVPPQGVVSMTPKPIPLVKDLVAGLYGDTAVTRGSLYDNIGNLAPEFVEAVIARYASTRLGLQEIHGHLIEEVEGALWKLGTIEEFRHQFGKDPLPDRYRRVVVGVDPAGSSGETGIVVSALDYHGQVWVLGDYTTSGADAEVWGAAAVRAYHEHEANAVVAETNYGGDMVRSVIALTDPAVNFEAVRATRGKQVRAEPVAMLYPKGVVHHVGMFGDLEAQLVTWVPGDDSPDRLDALVWSVTALIPELAAPPARATAPTQRTVTRAGPR